jgi:hypothetical protein
MVANHFEQPARKALEAARGPRSRQGDGLARGGGRRFTDGQVAARGRTFGTQGVAHQARHMGLEAAADLRVRLEIALPCQGMQFVESHLGFVHDRFPFSHVARIEKNSTLRYVTMNVA